MSLFLQNIHHISKSGNPYHAKDGKFTTSDGEWTKISDKKGSNPGGVHTSPDGSHSYVKFYTNPDQARTEVAAANIFELMGVPTPHPRIEQTKDGRTALVTTLNPSYLQLKPVDFGNLTEKQAATAAKAYVAAVITKNWDVVGLEYDNLVLDKSTNDLVEVDAGGSFRYRAQGEEKPFGKDIADADSLLDPQYPAGKVFSDLADNHPKALYEAYNQLGKLTGTAIKNAVYEGGPDNSDEIISVVAHRAAEMLYYMEKKGWDKKPS